MANPFSRAVSTWLAVASGVGLLLFLYLYQPNNMPAQSVKPGAPAPKKGPPPANLETAVFGTGCFWCSQAVFERVDGVWSATCGYMGGTVPNPTYEQVCTDLTGHAEVVQLKFDPKVITYEQLLDWFWRMHDPTTLNRQGADTGTQYRSVIFYYSDAQKTAAEKSKAEAQKHFSSPIVTQITSAASFPFYSAEAYHQEYFNNNSSQGYCQLVIAPKLDKLHLTEKPTQAPGAK